MGGGGSSSSYSESVTYHYEPDAVKKAEIEAHKEIAVQKLKGENINLQKEAMIDLMETNARLEQLMIEEKIQGFVTVKDNLMDMTRELNLIGEQRIKLLENASGDSLKRVNEHYFEFNKKFNQDSTDFMINSVPEMMKQLNLIGDKDSPAFQTFHKHIDVFISNFTNNQNEYLKQMREQQNKLMESNSELRAQITAHINGIVDNRVRQLDAAIEDNKMIKGMKKEVSKQLEGGMKELGTGEKKNE